MNRNDCRQTAYGPLLISHQLNNATIELVKFLKMNMLKRVKTFFFRKHILEPLPRVRVLERKANFLQIDETIVQILLCLRPIGRTQRLHEMRSQFLKTEIADNMIADIIIPFDGFPCDRLFLGLVSHPAVVIHDAALP
ncbi:hypothetical protein D3C73_1032030 [compost metagenome]